MPKRLRAVNVATYERDQYVLKHDPYDCYMVGGSWGQDQIDAWARMKTLPDGLVFEFRSELWITYRHHLLRFFPSIARVMLDGHTTTLAMLMPDMTVRLANMGVLSPVWQCLLPSMDKPSRLPN